MAFIASFAVALALVPAAPAGSIAPGTTIEQLRKACKVGSDPTPNGSMPTAVSGVVIVSPREAKCTLDRFKDVVLIAPMRDIQQIPNAHPIVSLAVPPDNRDSDARFQPAVTKLTGGDLSRPIMVYCHHTSCGYSYNAALHLRRMGYTNILWLREGVKGWSSAGYPLATLDQVRAPMDEAAYLTWFKAGSDYTFGCFGEKKAGACDIMVYFLDKSFTDPALPEKERDVVAGQLYNAAAVRAENLREAGKLAESYEASKAAYASLMDYADGGAKVGVLSGNAKVLREYALSSLESGRPGDATQFLALARRDGGKRYAQLKAAPKGSEERKAIQGAMVAMEHLERDLAEYAAKKATTLYKAGKQAEADSYRRITDDAVDHAVLWIERNGKEGVGHMMDLAPEYRIGQIKLLQGDLAKTAGDNKAALKAYNIGSSATCSLVDPKELQKVLDGGQASDIKNDLFARQCYTLTARHYVLSPQFRKWAAAEAKREYDLYMSLLRD